MAEEGSKLSYHANSFLSSHVSNFIFQFQKFMKPEKTHHV